MYETPYTEFELFLHFIAYCSASEWVSAMICIISFRAVCMMKKYLII